MSEPQRSTSLPGAATTVMTAIRSTLTLPSDAATIPVRTSSGRPIELEVALESLSALSAMAATTPQKSNLIGMSTRNPGGSGSSGRSLSPPPSAVSGSRVHLHPTSTPPRLTGSSILHQVNSNVASAKKLFFSAAAPSSQRAEPSASVKSAATAAFIAAQEAARRGRPPLGLPPAFSPPAPTPSPQSVIATAARPIEPIPPAKNAMRRGILEAELSNSLAQLALIPRHANSAQFHFVAGLHALRKGEWTTAETSLRKADQLYAPSVAEGSTLARITSQGTEPERQLSSSAPIVPDEIELTQPMELDLTQPSTSDNDAAGFTLTPPTRTVSTSAPAAGVVPSSSTSSSSTRSKFVSRKAADIKTCLALAIWKGAYYASGMKDASEQTPTQTKAYSEAKKLFLEAIDLESGARAQTWNHLATFLSQTHSLEAAKSLLSHVLGQHAQAREDRRVAAVEAGEEEPREEDDNSWAISALKNNLAVLQLRSGQGEEAIMHLQDILARDVQSATESPNGAAVHNLYAVANYAQVLMQQQDYAGAQRLLEFCLRHDPQNGTYWTSLAICFEMQLSTVASGLGLQPENSSSRAPSNASSPPSSQSTQPSKATMSPRAAANAAAVAVSAAANGLATGSVPVKKFAIPITPLTSTSAPPSASSSTGGGVHTNTSTPTLHAAPSNEARRIEEMNATDSAIRKNIRFCLEKARFYETLDRSAEVPPTKSESVALPAPSAAPISLPSATAPASWTFRLALAQNLLQSARNETGSFVVRMHHYECAEHVLLSIKDLGGGRSEVYTVLGDLYSARAVSALLDPPENGGGIDASKRFKARAVAAYTKALQINVYNQTAWNQLSILFLHSGEMKDSNLYLSRLVRTIKMELGLTVPPAVVAPNGTTNEINYSPLSASDLTVVAAADNSKRQQLASVLCNLGISLQLSSMHHWAEQAYLDSARLLPDQAPTYMNLGNLYRELDQVDPALKAFSKALTIKPDYGMAWMNASLVYIQKGDWVNAYHFMEKAHAHGAHLASVRSNRSKLALLLTKLGFVLPLPPPAPNQVFASVEEVNAAVARSFRTTPIQTVNHVVVPSLPVAAHAKRRAPPSSNASSKKKSAASKKRKTGADRDASGVTSGSETTEEPEETGLTTDDQDMGGDPMED